MSTSECTPTDWQQLDSGFFRYIDGFRNCSLNERACGQADNLLRFEPLQSRHTGMINAMVSIPHLKELTGYLLQDALPTIILVAVDQGYRTPLLPLRVSILRIFVYFAYRIFGSR